MSWDDGKHAKVNKVQLTFDDAIRSIEVGYEGTNLQSQRRGTTVGSKSVEFTLSTDEYITNLSGYYKTTFLGDVITELTFKTNKKTYGPYGNKTQSYFSADAPSGNQIAGFLGSSGNALSIIDVHFAPIPAPGSIKPQPVNPGSETGTGGGSSKPGDTGTGSGNSSGGGGGSSKPGDTGGSGNGSGSGGGSSKPGDTGTGSGNSSGGGGGSSKPGDTGTGSGNSSGGGGGSSKPDDTGGSGNGSGGGGGSSNPGDTGTGGGGGSSNPGDTGTGSGNGSGGGGGSSNPGDTGTGGGGGSSNPGDTGTGSGNGSGGGGGSLNPGDTGTGGGGGSSNPGDTGTDSGKDGPGKIGPLGGDKGNEFKDIGFEGVKKITVGADQYSVTYIKIEYVKEGQVVVREHGTIRGELQEFSVDYPKDNIVAVGGTYNHIYNYDTTLITSLYFTTSKGFTSPLFGKTKGTEFNLKAENGGKLVGFHGRGGFAIDAIGAYFDTTGSQGGDGGKDGSKPVVPGTDTGSGSSTQKLDAQGGKGGDQWDDGSDHEGVTKIQVAVARGIVEQIKFDYIKNGQTKEGPEHGVKGGRAYVTTIEISHPNEYLISVKGWSDASNNIVGIQFITNTKTSEYCGFEKSPSDEGTNILLEVKDKKIVGFHGFADTHLKSLGAYFAPIASTPLKPSKKLKAAGGDEGASWDDGAFDGVKKIQVGQNNDGVSYVAIEYDNGSQKVLGDGHGKKSALGVETFELTPGEYLTTVGVYYDKLQIERRNVTLVTSLIFKTNKRDYSQFGMTGGEYVELKEEGQKIVGFHGKASDWVHQIGVYVAPITN